MQLRDTMVPMVALLSKVHAVRLFFTRRSLQRNAIGWFLEATGFGGLEFVSVLTGSQIIVGVSGGIAAYKAADFTSKLVQAGATVDVIMTDAAEQFVGKPTFQALSKRPVHTSVFEPWTATELGHISLGHRADAIVVIPATANTLARLATGLADDMLGAVVLSSRAPLIVVPAMEHEMYHHPATAANVDTLERRGVVRVGPERGRLASGEIGEGRMASPETVLGALRHVLGRNGPLSGKQVVISAGGTREGIDPVRYLGNRSSGLMGYVLAQSAIDFGASVTMVSSAIGLSTPYGVSAVPVETAAEMQIAVAEACRQADILIMAAAVADFRPADPRWQKIKKTPGVDRLTLELERTPDILASISRPGLLKIGFAAETNDLVAYAQRKLNEKDLVLVVANDAESTIGSADSAAHLIFADGRSLELPRLPKAEVADRIIREIAMLTDVAPQ
jgi:phosphopantothenoylcysteine decarboxylase/phosphopantothenate--cysteine ligase